MSASTSAELAGIPAELRADLDTKFTRYSIEQEGHRLLSACPSLLLPPAALPLWPNPPTPSHPLNPSLQTLVGSSTC